MPFTAGQPAIAIFVTKNSRERTTAERGLAERGMSNTLSLVPKAAQIISTICLPPA